MFLPRELGFPLFIISSWNLREHLHGDDQCKISPCQNHRDCIWKLRGQSLGISVL